MQTDMFGAKSQKVNLHIHTMRSDGALSPATALGVHKLRRPDSSPIVDMLGVRELNCEKLGSTVEVLCEGYDPVAGVHYGRSAAYSPEIDGKVSRLPHAWSRGRLPGSGRLWTMTSTEMRWKFRRRNPLSRHTRGV